MGKQNQSKDLEKGEGFGLDGPQPSASAASSVEAIGPGALAAEEMTKASDELAPADIEALEGIIRRAGGVDKLIRWLETHPSDKLK